MGADMETQDILKHIDGLRCSSESEWAKGVNAGIDNVMVALRASLGAAQVPSLDALCKAIEEADHKSLAEGNYMLDSDDCIAVLRETWAALSQPSQQGTK